MSEITLVKDQFKEITHDYKQLWIILLDKDYFIYKSILLGEMNHSAAFHILHPLVHRADLLFAPFLMTLKFHRISQFIKYEIFEYITNLLILTFYSGDAYQDTSSLIVFNIIISKYDNISEYLKRFSS